MNNRTIDTVFVKNLRASHVASGSEGAAAGVDLGASCPNSEPMAERDVTAVSAPTSLNGTIEGSNDGTTWALAGTFPQIVGVDRQIITLKRFRRYRSGATTIVGTSFTYSDKLIGIASEQPVTQP